MIPYVYILGMPHSGSTLLTFLLNAHPQLISVGEVALVGRILPARWAERRGQCSCGQLFYQCDFWIRVLETAAHRGLRLGHPDFFRFSQRAEKDAQNALLYFVESVLQVGGAQIFIDSSKSPEYLDVLARNDGIQLYVLDFYRDGRALLYAWLKHISHPLVDKWFPNWRRARFLRSWITRKLVNGWVRKEKERRTALQKVNSRYVFRLKYEDLCSQPVETMRSVFRFLGVDSSVDVTQGFKSQVEHHIIGNQMRLSRHDRILLDQKWIQALPAYALETFAKAGGRETNLSNGYVEQ